MLEITEIKVVSKPRILFIASFPPPVHGSSAVSEQIRESQLIKASFDIDYINIATSRALNERRNYFLKFFRILKAFLRSLWFLLTQKYDLCYCAITCHGGCFLRDSPFVLLCKMFGKKIVIHQHNKGMSLDVEKPLFRKLYPLVYNNVWVILLSWSLYPDIEKVVKRENVRICPNGIAASGVNGFPHTSNQIPHILFLSNMLMSKGVMVLLDALKILKEDGVGFICEFVGSETLDFSSSRFDDEVRLRGISEVAKFYGPKYNNEKIAFFERADIFVLPSFDEAFPLVILEAMSHELPVVSTLVGGIPDEVVDGENGYLVEPGNVKSLAKCLRDLLEDYSLREQMGQNSFQRYSSMFSNQCFESAMTRLLEDCCRHCSL